MSKITRLERNRYSILTNDLNHCYVCGKLKNAMHEIYYGRNRINSMKYGCCVPLCLEHHTGHSGVHNNIDLDNKLKQECQKKFIEVYPDINFFSIFYKNYL